jgi:hypothetical protein
MLNPNREAPATLLPWPPEPSVQKEKPQVTSKEQSMNKNHPSQPSSYPSSTSPDTSYSSRQLDILLHDRNSLGVYGAKIRVLEQVY